MASILRMRLTYRRMTLAALLAAARRLYIAFHIRFSASLHTTTKFKNISRLCVSYRFSGFPDLFYFSLLLQFRQIPSCCCVGDVEEFLHFVVRDFSFRVQRFQNLFEFPLLSGLNRGASFVEEIAGEVRTWRWRVAW